MSGARHDAAAVRSHEVGRDGVVVISTGSDDVIVRGTDTTVARVIEPSADVDDIDVQATPGRLDVRLGGPWRAIVAAIQIGSRSWGTQRGRGIRTLRMEVPRTARLEVTTSSGDVDVEGVLSGATVKTVSGDVSLRATSGTIATETTSGDVGIDALGKLALRLASVSGDLRVVAATLHRTSVTTVSGDVSIDGRPDPAGDHAIQTTSGDIHLALAGGATVSTQTVSGDVYATVPARRDSGRGSPIVLGDGAARISVRTLSGDVNVAPSRRPVEPAPRSTAPASATIPLAEATAPTNRGPMLVPPARPMPPIAPIPPMAPAAPAAPSLAGWGPGLGARTPAQAPAVDAEPTSTTAPAHDGAFEADASSAAAVASAGAATSDPDATIVVLEALARGEIDVAEAERRLGAASGGEAGRG